MNERELLELITNIFVAVQIALLFGIILWQLSKDK